MDEDPKTIGVGLQWLTHLVNGDAHNKVKNQNHHLSNGGKKILAKLLKDNHLRDDTKNKKYDSYGDDDDDEDENEESDNDDNSGLGLNHERWEIEDESNRPILFETILGVIYKLYKKYNSHITSNDDNNSASRSSKDGIKTPPTKEIMKECISRLELELEQEQEQERSEEMQNEEGGGKQKIKILRPANIPCSLDSNQFIFSALLFLSEDIYQDLPSNKSISVTDDGKNSNNNTYFPKMPLLTKRKISSSSSTGSDGVMIPGGFQINLENIILSSEHDDDDDDDDDDNDDIAVFDKEFLRKLSILESCFLSVSSKIEHIPRLHVIPRVGMGFIQNRDEEERLMKLGHVGKAGLLGKRKR